MKIVLCGAGRVGISIAEHLATEDNDITVIDSNNESIQKITLTGGGLIAKFINWGAVLQDLKFESDSKSF